MLIQHFSLTQNVLSNKTLCGSDFVLQGLVQIRPAKETGVEEIKGGNQNLCRRNKRG
jgi:hypothetical protein